MDESQKKSIMMAILAFNITFILFMVLFNFGESFSYAKVMLGLLIAGGAAAGGFFASKMMG